MSEPKRYTDLQVWEALHFAGSTNGWIRWDDYARLKAENERLTEIVQTAHADLFLENARLKAENARLRASSFVTAVPVEQYERLREAGDALAAWTLTLEHTYDHKPMDGLPFSSFLCLWHEAAKEGKQP